MAHKNFESQSFKNQNFATSPLLLGTYDNCQFINCNFSGTDLPGFTFAECTFQDCDFSQGHFTETKFNEVLFLRCKLLGMHFESCSSLIFLANFEACQLNYASFFKMNLKGTSFKDCQIHEADFSEANLSEADFSGCDLKGSNFEFTNLSQVDFTTAEHFTFDPERNTIKGAKFSQHGALGLLSKYDITIQ